MTTPEHDFTQTELEQIASNPLIHFDWLLDMFAAHCENFDIPMIGEEDNEDAVIFNDWKESIRAALQLAINPWNDRMEDAPRDGTEVLVKDEWGVIKHVYWCADMGGCWAIKDHDDDLRLNPMFQKEWMPLPLKPAHEER